MQTGSNEGIRLAPLLRRSVPVAPLLNDLCTWAVRDGTAAWMLLVRLREREAERKRKCKQEQERVYYSNSFCYHNSVLSKNVKLFKVD